MKKAKITNQDGYRCAPEGHSIVVIPFGTVVEGKIAEWALADKAASAMFDPVVERKVVSAPETKIAAPTPTKKRGRKGKS